MLTVQTCNSPTDPWTDTEIRFHNKEEAQAWFNGKFKDFSCYEWRVGFLVRTPEGKYFRVVLPNGDQVHY